MTGLEFLFLVALLGSIAVVGLKAYNLMSEIQWYSTKWVFLLLMATGILWLFGLVTFAADPEELLYRVGFVVNSFMMVLSTLLTAGELIFTLKFMAFQAISPMNAKKRR